MYPLGTPQAAGVARIEQFSVGHHTQDCAGAAAAAALIDSFSVPSMVMMMPFICSCRNKIGAELHIYLEEGTYHKRLFRGPITNDMKQ
jgi:hypothetical protein